MADLARRSVAKTMSWRVFATITTAIIAHIFLRDAAVSTDIAISTNKIKGTTHYLNKRIWDRADWGRSIG